MCVMFAYSLVYDRLVTSRLSVEGAVMEATAAAVAASKDAQKQV
jgi:hypothetical protein